jgi:hypothetical protein
MIVFLGVGVPVVNDTVAELSRMAWTLSYIASGLYARMLVS